MRELEKKLKKYVNATVDYDGEIITYIGFTDDEINHLLWKGADSYDLSIDPEKRVELEDSISTKIGLTMDFPSVTVERYGQPSSRSSKGDERTDYTKLMDDRQIVGGAYELAVLLQYGCEHKGLRPTAENMAAIHDGIADERPLDRAAALEYAGYLIESAANEVEQAGEREELPF